MAVKVAALYDVHGNLPALEAVLAEVPSEVEVVFGGDLVWGPWPRECLEVAESLGGRARFVRGNCDTLVLVGSGEHAWAHEQLDQSQLRRIASWPANITLDVDGLGPTLFCHATPDSEDDILFAESPVAIWTGALANVVERTVVCGHTHLAYDTELCGRRIVNPGSVGAPTVRPVAWWALLGPAVEPRTTSYDTDAAIAAAATLVPDVRPFARWLREPPSSEERIAMLEAL